MLKSADYNKLLIIDEAKNLINIAKKEGNQVTFTEALEVIKISKLEAISDTLKALKRKP